MDFNTYLDECFDVAVDTARKGGEMIRAAFKKQKTVECKEGMADLVTETDQQVEKTIIETFKNKFPAIAFIGEESVAAGEKCNLTEEPTWIVDPVDGTTNFVHSFPNTAVSIALLVNKKPEIAVIYNPIRDEMYTARPGKGAFCNGEKITVSSVPKLQNALICAEFGSSREAQKLDAKIRTMSKIVTACHGIRSMGSAALNMCLVASGAVDGYVEYGMHCWDIAAGNLIVTEAGGVVSSPDGSDVDIMSRSVLCAANNNLIKELVPLIEHVSYVRDDDFH